MVIYLSVLKVRLNKYRELLALVSNLVAEYGDCPVSMEEDLDALREEVSYVEGLFEQGFMTLEVRGQK